MKRSWFGLAALLLLVVGCGSTSPLVGAWELVDDPRPPGSRQVKILSETHFAFGSLGERGEARAGGGTYVYDGSSYTEILAYHFEPELAGKSLRFDIRMEDGIWYHDGEFNVGGKRFWIHERWRRLDDGDGTRTRTWDPRKGRWRPASPETPASKSLTRASRGTGDPGTGSDPDPGR